MILNQFAAAFEKWFQLRIQSIKRVIVYSFGFNYVALKIEICDFPLGITVGEVSKLLKSGNSGRLCPA